MGRTSQALLFGLQRLSPEFDARTDRELLQRFAAGRDELCFAALVRRHGAMVFAACRRALRNDQDAEDVFQAVFLVLARKAGSGRWRDCVGAWLHEVARRLAAEAHSRDVARRRREQAAARPEFAEAKPASDSSAFDDELARLPDDERAAVILCQLEGRPREQAARSMGLSLRTFERRLAGGMQRLRVRLEARGVSPGLPAATMLPTSAAALARRAVEFAAGAIDATVPAALANGVLKGASMARLKIAAVAVTLALTGFGTWALSPRDGVPLTAAPAPKWPAGHRYASIDPDWRVEEALLDPRTEDPPDGYDVVQPKDRDPNNGRYLTEKRYYEKGKTTPRRIVRWHPSGRLAEEIDNVGKEQHSRSWHPDGSKAQHLHWRDGKWLDGESISPDGKERHRLVRGEGELVTYGSKQGNRVHRWYADARNFLDKHYLDGRLIRVRLNGKGDKHADWLIVEAEEERLAESKGIWTRRGGQASWQAWEDFGKRDRQPPTRPYDKARASFVADYGVILKDAGRTWDKLGIDFVRADKAWPKAAR